MDINGLNVGCFTAETKRDGKVFFEFVTSNHPDLRKKPVVGIRVFAGTPSHPVFKVMVIVQRKRRM